MGKSITFSVKTLFVALFVVIVAVAGYFFVPRLFGGPSLAGKTFVEQKENKASGYQIISFIDDTKGFIVEISPRGRVSPNINFTYVLDNNKLSVSMMGMFGIDGEIKWLGPDKFTFTYDDKIENYAEQGSGSDHMLF